LHVICKHKDRGERSAPRRAGLDLEATEKLAGLDRPGVCPGVKLVCAGSLRRGEGAVVRELAPCADRGWPVEPGEEGQLLEFVGHSVRHFHVDRIRPGQGIAYFEVILAAAYLSHLAPGGSWVIPEGIVHPLVDFVGGKVGVGQRDVVVVDEVLGGVVVEWGIGLYRSLRIEGVVEAEDAAVGDASFVHHDVVQHENGESGGTDSLSGVLQCGNDLVFEIGDECIEIQPKGPQPWLTIITPLDP
jgi:hypothetical protein